jgi:hypothetical protein
VAQQARRTAASLRRARKQAEVQMACPHDGTITDHDGLPQCDICSGYGPWAGHPTHGHFPNGDPVT